MSDIRTYAFPEIEAGGFTRIDGTIEFYGRINALLRPDYHVLDVGAGRGEWADRSASDFRCRLRLMRGKVAEVIGHDIDPAVLDNRGVDRVVMSKTGDPLPFPDAHFDMIIADYVFEHIEDSSLFSKELKRILKAGGWLCARTPNKWGYVSILTRLIRNDLHTSLLRLAQPARKEVDVFPTVFGMNTMRDLQRAFPPEEFIHFSYFYQPEPSYYFNSRLVFGLMRFVDWVLPRALSSNIFVFLRVR
jgi:SAM-dependent methyltransferase